MKILPLDEHHLLVFWAQLVVLLVAARLLGGAARRVGQPAVIGELAAGLLLGPTVLGKVWPAGAKWLFPPDEAQSAMLLVVGWLGIVMLLVVTGFETDLALVRRLGRAAVATAGGSVAVPFALGFVTGQVLPQSFTPEGTSRAVFALFIAAALSISSLPVIAKILGELGLTRRNFGQLTLAAGMANDVVGWLVLGAIAGIARSGSLQLGRLLATVAGMAAFLALAFTVGQRAADSLLRRARARRTGLEGALAVTLALAFLAGAITQALGVEAVLGAFVAGIVLGRSRFQDARVVHSLESITAAVFAPLFFATAGLRVDLGLLARPDVLAWAAVVVAVATAGKFGGAFLGGRMAGLVPKEGLALGVGLNARGALEIVIATVGLSLGVLNSRSYTVVVLMAIVTSMAAPPMLRALARGWAGTEEEQRRLSQEETLRTNVLVRPSRLLLPAQRGDGSVVAARILDLAWPAGPGATVLAVEPDGPTAVDAVRAAVHRRSVEVEELAGEDVAAAVVDHMGLGYGVTGIGAREGRGEGELLSPLTEAILARSPLPVVVVWEGRGEAWRAGGRFEHVLVPVVGTVANRAAQELAFALAAESDAEVTITHVVTEDGAGGARVTTRERSRSGTEVATGLLAEAADLARRSDLRPRALVRTGTRADEIVAVAEESGVDLVVLSAELQPVAGLPFLGDLVETVLTSLDTSVAVVAVPAQWRGAAS